MGEANFTKGPWKLVHWNGDDVYEVVSENGGGAVVNTSNCNKSNHKANAHLIAAAPELYEALAIVRSCVRVVRGPIGTFYKFSSAPEEAYAALIVVDKVLRKARGEQ